MTTDLQLSQSVKDSDEISDFKTFIWLIGILFIFGILIYGLYLVSFPYKQEIIFLGCIGFLFLGAFHEEDEEEEDEIDDKKIKKMMKKMRKNDKKNRYVDEETISSPIFHKINYPKACTPMAKNNFQYENITAPLQVYGNRNAHRDYIKACRKLNSHIVHYF